ncbi:MAG: hypothetical protein AB1486_05810 [Planctomycetota bacterium]
MSLRLRLLLAFLLPSVMMVVAGIWSSYQMRSLGNWVTAMLDENDRSIRYAVTMREALERLETGLLLRMHGDDKAYEEVSSSAVTEFEEALRLAFANITIPGEGEILSAIDSGFKGFLSALEKTKGKDDPDSFHLLVSPVFSGTKKAISDLRLLNTRAMYETAQNVIDRAARAALPGDLILLAAVVFALLFAWLIQLCYVRPFYHVLQAVERWCSTGRLEIRETEAGGNELSRLVQALQAVAGRGEGR